jgi:hypothetical protein
MKKLVVVHHFDVEKFGLNGLTMDGSKVGE